MDPIEILRGTEPHEESPLPWKVFTRHSDVRVIASNNLGVAADLESKDAAHLAAAVNAAPVLLAEIDRLRAQLAAAREALRPVVHQKWCDAMAFRGCDCGAVMRNDEALGNARRVVGLEV